MDLQKLLEMQKGNQISLFGCEDCGRYDEHLVSTFDKCGRHKVCEDCKKNYMLADFFQMPKYSWLNDEV